MNVTIIHPATEKHIQKYMKQQLHWVDETIEIYQNITLPHINSNYFSLEWVDNILDHKAEQDRIIFEDPHKETGFMLVPDLKWTEDTQTMHLLVLPFVSLKSIRELTGSHLPLLKNIKNKVSQVVEEKFHIKPSQLRMYFHYQPSFYHLHVHCTNLMYEAPGTFIGKAHPLSTVIYNLELDPNYYSKATLSFTISETDSLYSKLKDLHVGNQSNEKPTNSH